LLRSGTFWIGLLCLVFYGANTYSSWLCLSARADVGLTTWEKVFVFDYPQAMELWDQVIDAYHIHTKEEIATAPILVKEQLYRAEHIPMWHGIMQKTANHPRICEKLAKGQIWRAFSPCLLHKDLFHLIFNLGWFFLLGLQIEKRLFASKYIALILCVGCISNLAQYIVSGPCFLGLSGVVTGLVGFIWSRQKCAPLEGYPLSKTMARFVFYFVLVMIFLEGCFLVLEKLFPVTIPFNIANTAHIVGGLVGMGLGRIPLFARKKA